MQSKCYRHSSKDSWIVDITKSVNPNTSEERTEKDYEQAQPPCIKDTLNVVMGAAILQILRDGGTYFLPVNNFVYDFTLLCSSLSQIDSCGFNALMPHKISQKRDIIAPLQETFGKAMAEGMWIYNDRIDFIAGCQFL